MRSRQIVRAGLVSLTLLALTTTALSPSQARTWRVWKDGSGDFTAIQPAVDAAAPGDTVLIGPGRYTESFDFAFDNEFDHGETFVGIETDDLTLMGVHRDSVVIGPLEANFQGFLPKGIAMRLDRATGLRVESLTVRKVREGLRLLEQASAFDVALDSCDIGIVAWTNALLVDSCRIADSPTNGATVARSTNASFRRCVVERSYFTGISFVQSQSCRVEDSLVRDNAVGIKYQQGSSGSVLRTRVFDNHQGAISLIESTVDLQYVVARGGEEGISAELNSHVTGVRNVLGPFTLQLTGFLGDSTIQLHNSDLLVGDAIWAVRTGGYPVGGETVQLDFRNNYWGPTTAEQLPALIRDGNDDPSIDAFVLFEPILTESAPTEQQSVGGFKAGYRSRQDD